MPELDKYPSSSGIPSTESESVTPVIEIPIELSRALGASGGSQETIDHEIRNLNDLPFEQALGIYSRIVAENSDIDVMSSAAGQMITQLDYRLGSMRDADRTLQITPE